MVWSAGEKSPVDETWIVIRVIALPHPGSVNEREMSGAMWSVSTLAVKTGRGSSVWKDRMAEAPPTPRLFVAVACA